MEACSLTPATSFSLTQGGGNARERYIIWRAVLETPYVKDTVELKEFFQMGVQAAWTDAEAFYQQSLGLEPVAREGFSRRMGLPPDLDERSLAAAKALDLNRNSWRSLLKGVSETAPGQVKHQAHLVARVRGQIRLMFVEACAQNLKADLFILDEFQRFSKLLNIPDAEAAGASDEEKVSEEQIIAKRVLHEGDGYATLLLSATPFKALTHLGEEQEGKAHAQELMLLLKYLCESNAAVLNAYQTRREALLGHLLTLPPGPLAPNSLSIEARDAVESTLRPYICRSERAGIEPDIERIFSNPDVEAPPRVPDTAEIESFVALDQLAEALKQATEGAAGRDIMMFHKAAPWSLSFLGGYQLRESLRKNSDVPEVAAALKRSAAAWIPYEKLERYRIDLSREAPSSRFMQVLQAAAPEGAERLLWIPPSLQYYEPDGPFAGKQGFSKTLLFSSLVLAPRALSSYVSYECERRLLPERGKRPHYFEDRDDFSRTFKFDVKSLSPVWGLVYPSMRLAAVSLGDPASSLAEVRRLIHDELASDFKRLVRTYGRGNARKGARWYTLAPLLLDWLTEGGPEYVKRWAGAMSRHSASAETRKAQVVRLSDLLRQVELDLGEPPKDLLPYLVDLAIAGPGVCLSRSLAAIWEIGEQDSGYDALLARTTDGALSFVDKMNRIESQRVLRAVCPRDKPWAAVARYGAMGNLQAVFDEYMHLLKSVHGTLAESVAAFQVSVGTGAVSITAQTRLPPPTRTNKYDVRFHCHYAVPLGNQKGTDEKGISRITNARASFNSPFWPFMLNSTSIGQEGLDFHWYCRRIVHWSLPPNPIDLEQREGRINRFKSLVVRQRVADAYGRHLSWPGVGDVWSTLFALAKKDARHTDLVPFWHSPLGSTRIERIVPALAFSSEVSRLDEILRIVSLYRLSFGQPRQQELVENLLKRNYSESDLAEIRRALLIDLAPVNYLNAKKTDGRGSAA